MHNLSGALTVSSGLPVNHFPCELMCSKITVVSVGGKLTCIGLRRTAFEVPPWVRLVSGTSQCDAICAR